MKFANVIKLIKGRAYRVVEDQEEIATLELVDDIEEQILLEKILDNSKPVPTNTPHLDYLITTPFRYPPLRHGSRFGSRHENSFFYGSLSKRTALAETAYYRCLFWEGMTVKPSSGYKTSHTIFQLSYQTDHGIQLQGENFKKHHLQLTHPSDYQFTQAIGSNMREQGITGFEFISARDMSGGINVAFFNPKPIRSKRPLHKETLTCLTHNDCVVFKLNGSLLSFTYPKANFSPNGFFARIR